MTLAALFGGFFVLLAAGMPVVFAMGAVSFAFLLAFGGGVPLTLVPHEMVAGMDNFPLLAIPFFFLAGEIMNAGGITQRLVDFSAALVGGVRGGLAYVVVVTNMIMAGFSGSAVADASATGSVLIPAMKREGYRADFAASVTAAAATIGPIIPPSIPMIVYAVVADASVGALFLGGVVPGLMMAAYLFAVIFLLGGRRSVTRLTPRLPVSVAFRRAAWALLAPVIILGGIVAGVVTPTEAGALAVLYSFVIAVFVHREMGIGELPRLLRETAVGTGVIMIIVGASGVMAWLVANMRIGEAMVAAVTAVTTSPVMVLLLVNLFFLLVGCVMDPIAGMLVFVPVFLPLVKHVGIDPVHFGVVVVLNLMIGLLTPPVGYLLYLSAKIAEISVDDVVREIVPFLVALLVVLGIITYWPALVLALPGWLAPAR